MSAITKTTTVNLSVSRFIKAPIERVFAAWTTPDDLMKWFGPNTCQALAVKLDPRVGGQYRVKIHSDGMGDIELFGVYREVRAPNRLVFTFKWSGGQMDDVPETLVSVDFQSVADGTDVLILQDELSSPEIRDDHTEGWTGSLIKLSRLLAPNECAGPQPPVGTVCWNELLTSDLSAGTTFYSRLFGWQSTDSPVGNMQYKMFQQRLAPVGGAMTQPAPQVPPHWLAYVRVDDVDRSVRQATTLGGKLAYGPMDIPTVGRIAVIQDPQGAVIGLFTPKREE